MSNPQPEVEEPGSYRTGAGELNWLRPGLTGRCRCVYGQLYAPFYGRHPECPVHPPMDEVMFWGAITITLLPGYL